MKSKWWPYHGICLTKLTIRFIWSYLWVSMGWDLRGRTECECFESLTLDSQLSLITVYRRLVLYMHWASQVLTGWERSNAINAWRFTAYQISNQYLAWLQKYCHLCFCCQVGAFYKFWQNLISSLHLINIKDLELWNNLIFVFEIS